MKRSSSSAGPRQLGPYELVSELGRGAMGVVWRARHRPTGAERAVKVIEMDERDPELALRFEREAATLARVGGHAHIVRVHDAGVEGRHAFYAMDLIEGKPLHTLFANGPMDARAACLLMAKLADAVAHCHAHGVVHRDLKPGNVLLDGEGEPRLVDFGLVRDMLARRLTTSGMILGTPAYMSPEQILGHPAGEASDVHALGLLVYEALAGARPYTGKTVNEIVQALVDHRFAPLEEKRPDLPVALVELVRRALESAPEARPSAREVARGLEAVARALGRRRLVPAGKVKRYRRVAAALVAVSLLLAGAIGFAGWRRGSVHAERVETARSLAELARARLAADDVGALLLARAAQGFEAASGEALDPGCDATLALAALARGSDALSVAAATSALAREPSRREELLLVRGRARLGLRDVDGVLEDVRGLATPDARRLRIQALLVGRRWTDILALEGTDAFLAAARVAARLDGELARAPLGQIETAFADARRAVHDEPEITALLFEMAARAEIAGVASLIGVTRERLPSEFAVDPVRYTKDRNLLFDPIVAATHALEEALKRPRHLLDVASELDSIDLALAVLETNPFNLRTNPDGQDLDAPRKRGELKALACELEGVAVAIAPGPADALSHRVRTFLVIQWLWDRNDPERRAFLEANVGKGPPAVDSYLRVGLLLAVERDFLSGRTPAREAVEEFEKHLDKIDPSLPTPSGEVSLRAHFEELTAELSVRAMTEEPAAAAARLETAARHQAEGRRILERAGKAVVRSESLGRDILRAAAEVALAGRDLAAAERAIEELASAEKTRDAPELLFRAEVMKRKGDLEAAARFVADAERAPDDVMRMGTERDWFQLDWYVERLLLEHGRGAVDARERLESLRRDRRPPLLPWIDDEVRKLIGG